MISNILRFADMTLLGIEVGEKIQQLSDPKEDMDSIPFRQLSIASKSAILSLNVIEFLARLGNASNASIRAIKSLETTVKVVDIPIEMFNAILDYDKSNISLGKAFEKGLLVPISRLGIAIAQNRLLEAKCDLELPDGQKPIYKLNDTEDKYEIVGYTTVDVEESLKLIEECKINSDNLGLAALLFNLGIVDKSTAFYYQLYQSLSGNKKVILAPPIDIIIQDVKKEDPYKYLDTDQLINDDPFDLVCKDSIPDLLVGDCVFYDRICPISGLPIRFPIAYNGVIYDLKPLKKWLSVSGNRDPLLTTEFDKTKWRRCKNLQLLIDTRLQFHSGMMRKVTQIWLSKPLPQVHDQVVNDAQVEVLGIKNRESTEIFLEV